MTTLIVTPIDLSKPGSYRERKRFMALMRSLRGLREGGDPDISLAALEAADTLILSKLRTDDDTPVEDALDQLSANQFDQLLASIAFEGGDGVGEASGPPSADSTGDTAMKSPTGSST